MSKEIINGVNVAECERLWNGQCTGKDNKLLGNCIDLDCELKQLKRLQAENELLNEKVKTLDKMTGIYSARLCKKYKQALEEIRGILDKSCEQCKNEYLSEDYCSGQGDCFEIRQVINEVLK